MKINDFTLETMTDADLESLYLSAHAERIRRADNKRKRTAWVNKYYHQYQLSIASISFPSPTPGESAKPLWLPLSG